MRRVKVAERDWPFRWKNRRALETRLAHEIMAQGVGEELAFLVANVLPTLDLGALLLTTVESGETLGASGTTVTEYQRAGRLTTALEKRMTKDSKVAIRLYWRPEVEYVEALRSVHPPGFDGPNQWEPDEDLSQLWPN